jgi:hypothetical protein
MVDLINGFQEGMRNILNWRNRYTEDEYPGKVVLNIFYRKYSMEAMWDDMLPYINHSVRKDFNEAVRELEMAYSRSASFKVHNNLIMYLRTQPEYELGGTSYEAFGENIRKAAYGDKAAREEIEFAYLYNLLMDKATLYWGAACSTGLDKIKAIGFVTGYIIEDMPINDYNTINIILGRLGAAPYLNKHYNPLP